MHEEAALDRIHRQLQENLFLINSRGHQMQNDVLDLLVRWNDSRGQDFARTELMSLVDCRDQAIEVSRRCTEASELALNDLARGENLVAQALGLIDDLAGLVSLVDQDAQQARDYIRQATVDANEGRHLAQDAMAMLTALGNPR